MPSPPICRGYIEAKCNFEVRSINESELDTPLPDVMFKAFKALGVTAATFVDVTLVHTAPPLVKATVFNICALVNGSVVEQHRQQRNVLSSNPQNYSQCGRYSTYWNVPIIHQHCHLLPQPLKPLLDDDDDAEDELDEEAVDDTEADIG
uniref:Uncharacterized protein n=1 Tax=Glossina pallidipes TaxID=7398 RepID=A0A1B0A547_GLOPL